MSRDPFSSATVFSSALQAAGRRPRFAGMGIAMASLLGAVLSLGASGAHATVIDFDSAGVAGDTDPTITQDGITVTVTGGRLGTVGGSFPGGVGWAASAGTNNVSAAYASVFNGLFLGHVNGVAPGTMSFAFDQAVSDVSFYVADIDAEESFTVAARDAGGGTVSSVVIADGDPGTGDSIATLFSLPGSGIRSVTIDFTDGNNLAAFGIDTLTFNETGGSAIPMPGLIGLMGLALPCLSRRSRG